MAEFFERLIPENTKWFRHTTEGPDGATTSYYPQPISPGYAYMGANVRITITDPTGADEEYFYDATGREAEAQDLFLGTTDTWYVDPNHWQANTSTYNNGAANVP